MRRLQTLFVLSFLFLTSLQTTAQNYQTMPGYRFSKEDRLEFYLYESKKLKTKGFGALIVGSALTGVGVYLMNKDPYELSGGSGGYYSIRESKNLVIGKIVCAVGVGTTLASIPLFISAGKAKRQAQLLLKDEPTSFLQKSISVPSIGLQFPL